MAISPGKKESDLEVDAVKVVSNYAAAENTEWALPLEIDETYLAASKSAKFWRSVLFQMVLFGALSFVGPAMSDAISNLGGGGLSTPWLGNLANSLQYATGCMITLFGGPLINKIGIKWACVIAALSMPLTGSGYYVSARYGVNWYLLTAQIIGGFASGFLYVAETTAMLSYPDPNDRGLFLGIWSAMRNSGSIIGGAINFSTNYTRSAAGSIAWSTYLIFVGFATRKVRRSDGSKFAALGKHIQRKKTWLVFIPAFYSFFYGGTMGTYLSLHFSVRARALSSLITPCITIPMVMLYGKLLDVKRWSQMQRACIAFALWVIPQIGGFIWVGIEYHKFGRVKFALDYGLFTTGYLCQLSLYWILGTFSTDVKANARTGGLFRAFETLGQATSYGINSRTGGDPRTAFYVNCALLALTIPCMAFLILLVPEAPAHYDNEADGPIIEGVAKTN
ncbi:membrane protein [Hyaloscypha finlandica]|nr:membrane protein [Hyaloscypha finlandica]